MYGEPIPVSRATTIKTRVITDAAAPGPVAEARYEVDDTTPPQVVEVKANALTPTLRVKFNEAVDKASATMTQSYLLEPETPINSVTLSDDGTTALLTVAAPLSADRDYHLKVDGVRDRSPNANAVATTPAQAQGVAVTTARPVFQLADADKPLEVRVADLPTKSDEPFTLNMSVRVDQQPMPRTLVAGFGNASDRALRGRYFASFADGIRFWASNGDVVTDEPLDVGKWQMLTAVYDGEGVTIYKNGKEIGSRKISLGDDEAVVRIRPREPWDRMRVIDADIRDFSVWSDALSAGDVEALYAKQAGAAGRNGGTR